jgi:hypothetical protein
MNSGFSAYGTGFGIQYGGFRKFSINPSSMLEPSTPHSVQPLFGAKYEAALRKGYNYTQGEIDRFKAEGKSPEDVYCQERDFAYETTEAKLETDLKRIKTFNEARAKKHRHTVEKHR